MQKKQSTNKAYHAVASIIIVSACIAAFYNGLLNDFAFDDYLAIVNNKDTEPHTPYSNLLKNDIWGKNLNAEDSHRSWRPLLILFFKYVRTNFEFKAHFFRAFSIAFHSIASLLVYLLSNTVIGNKHLAAGAALLFASHPVHVESVTAVVNIAESMSCITYIASYLIFLRFYDGIPSDAEENESAGDTNINIENNNNKNDDDDGDDDEDKNNNTSRSVTTISNTGSRKRGVFSYLIIAILWLVFVFIGILLKESGVTISAMIIAKLGIDAFTWAGRKCSKERTSWWKSVFSFLKYVFGYLFNNKFWCCMPLIAILMYLTLRDLVITGSIPTIDVFGIKIPKFGLQNSYLNSSQLLRKAENPFAELVGVEKAFSLMYLHFRYFWVMLWPVELSPEYAFDCIPKVSSASDPHFYKQTLSYYSGFIFCIVLGIVLIIRQPISSHARFAKNVEEVHKIDEHLPASFHISLKESKESPLADKKKEEVENSSSSTTTAAAAVATESTSSSSSTDAQLNPSILATKESVIPTPEEIEERGARGVKISRDALITTMAWFVVTFVPASGVFLKLGTLLAERLLYIPSIAFCIALSMAIFLLCRGLAKLIRLKKTSVGTYLYWILVIIITALYIRRTNEYNMSWKNDEVLFVNSLSVCPGSAKLQMQVAKLRINEGNFSAAAKHIEIARKIDPDFCDIGYQDALMSLFYYNNMEDAMEHLATNLACIYSNKQSFDLLNKLMDQQLAPNPKDISVLEYHGKLLSTHQMVSLGAKKYQAAADSAYNSKQFAKALILNKKAYDLIPGFMGDLSNTQESAYNGVVDLICNINAMGGTWRSEMRKMSPQPKGVTKSMLNTTTDMLMHATGPMCVLVDSSILRVVSNHALTAMASITAQLNGDFDRKNATTLFEFAILAEKSASAIMKIDLVGSLTAPNGTSETYSASLNPNGWNKQAFEFIVVARQLFSHAGKLEFKAGNYVLAADRFKRSLAYDFNIDGTLVQEPIQILSNYSFLMIDWWNTVKIYYSAMLPFQVERDSGFILYWYVHSIAGQSGFLDNKVQIGEVFGSYKAILERKKDKKLSKEVSTNEEMQTIYDLAAEEVAYLKQFCIENEGTCPDF